MKQIDIMKLLIATVFFALIGIQSAYSAPAKIDIIFVMDTSGSMSNEATALRNAIATLSQDLSNVYDLETKSWGITQTKSSWGLTSNVKDEIPQATSNQSEDWGPATYDIATYYTGWRTDIIKIVVPISDEGPQDGGGYRSYLSTTGGDALNQDDTDSINLARDAVDNTEINVVPVISEGNHQDLIYSDYALLLSDKAIKTGSGDLVAQFKTIIADIVAEASGTTLGSVSANFIENFNGGKLIINAKGASDYQVEVKFDGTTIYAKSTQNSTIPVSFPSSYDNKIAHTLDIAYTAFATDASGQILDQISKTLTYTTQVANVLVTKYPELMTATIAPQPIFLGAGDDPRNQVQSSSHVADPVDISSGNFIFSNNDLVISTAGTALIIKRFYNSLEPIRGWKFNIDNTMDISDINNIKVSWQGGNSKDVFVKAKEGWVSIYSTDTLTTEVGSYVVTKGNGTKYKFDTAGKLIEITNRKNLGIRFEYSGLDTIIKDSFSNLLATVTRNSSSQITSITDANNNTISYTYNGTNLVSYNNRNGDSETYQYTGDLITSILGADNLAYVSNTFDAQGRVTSQLDGSANQTTFVYTGDLANFIVDSTDVTYADGITRTHNFKLLLPTKIEGSGTTISFDYDANNIVKQITDTNGKTWSYERNSAGLITKSTDPQGNQTLKQYDASNNLISSTNALGKTVTFEYDANNNLIKSTNADGKVNSFEYNANNQISKVTNVLNQETTFAYNAQARLETVTRQNGATTSYTYDALGNVKTVTDALGRSINYDYDNEGKVTQITNALGYKTKLEYNSFGDLVKITDAKNRNISMDYNVDGLLTKTTLVDGTTIESTYDVLGRVISSKDVLGRETKKEYDDFGRVSKIIDPKGNQFLLDYDAIGNLIKVTDAKGNNVQTEYDELYRPSKTIDADGVEVATTSYNALSLPTKVQDVLGKSVDFSFDALNRLQSSTLSGSLKAEALYDALGRITEITDPKGAKNSYEYDAVGNLVKETNPLNKENTYVYDVLGRVTSSTNPNGVTTNYTYDDLDRLIKLTQEKGTETTETSYTYDEVGNVLTVTDEQGTITYTYNINDQVATRIDIYGNTVGYTYDQAKRLASLTYPDGKVINYEYDDNNNLTKVTDFANRETLFNYDANGNLTKTTHVNGAYIEYTYDNNSRLLSLKNFNKQGTLVSANELTRNSIGDISDNQETSPATLDLAKIKSFNVVVNDFNQITSNAEGNFSHDDNGNLLSYTANGTAVTLNYDLSDALSTATIGADSFNYTYDAEGNRVAINSKRYLIDNVMGLSKPLAEMDASNSVSKYYIWTNGLGYSVDSAGEVLVYLYDYQGNTNAVLDASNKLKAAYRYTAYGSLMSADTALDNPFKYLGQHGIMSDSNALYYVRARYYSPQLNRWTQADIKRGGVANPLSLNRYVLNEGDGVNYIDLNGAQRTAIESYDGLKEKIGDKYAKKMGDACYGANSSYFKCGASGIDNAFYAASVSITDMFVKPSISCTSGVIEGADDKLSASLDCLDVALTIGTAGLSKSANILGKAGVKETSKIIKSSAAKKGLEKALSQTYKFGKNQNIFLETQKLKSQVLKETNIIVDSSKNLHVINAQIRQVDIINRANDIYTINKNNYGSVSNIINMYSGNNTGKSNIINMYSGNNTGKSNK